ncbi:MAG: DUF2062 domain-containing protein [Chromatiaceae bacterium]|nr:MAG: DUF2062 domain-containing protein [Chromatiaceae bacterium]
MKRWLTRVLPDPQWVRASCFVGLFGALLQDANLWHLNRRSTAGGVAVGLFVMFMPPVGQILLASAAAIRLRVNLPISVVLVWLSNPLTFPPLYYFAYVIGCRLIGRPVPPFRAQFWLDWHNWPGVLGPLSLGCLVCATVAASVGYYTIQLIWRWNLRRRIRLRRAR